AAVITPVAADGREAAQTAEADESDGRRIRFALPPAPQPAAHRWQTRPEEELAEQRSCPCQDVHDTRGGTRWWVCSCWSRTAKNILKRCHLQHPNDGRVVIGGRADGGAGRRRPRVADRRGANRTP